MDARKSSNNNDEHNNIQKSIDISGMSTLSGDVICLNLTVTGMAKVKGNIEVKEKVLVTGMSAFEKELIAANCEINGTAKIYGQCHIDDLNISGMCSCFNSLECQTINSSGCLKIHGNLSCDYLDGNGIINVDGLLSGDEIKLNFNHKLEIKEIGGKNISIKRGESLGFNIMEFFKKSRLYAELIEGDHIEIEHTHVNTVRGDDITIGEGCKVNYVEYKGKLNIHPNAEVDKVSIIEEQEVL